MRYAALKDASFGIQIDDLDLSREQPDEVIRELVALFHRHQLVKIPAQRLRLQDFDRVGRWFGQAHPHVVAKGRVEGFPAISLLTNADETRRDASAHWHTDNTYESVPATATMLWAKATPRMGGDTLVADMYTAYDTLPADVKRDIEGLRTLNAWSVIRADDTTGKQRPETAAPMDVVRHPLVLRHPVTGRKALYGVTGTSYAIEGLPPDEGIALLEMLTRHALNDAFVARVGYAAGDLAAWDTLATLHAATPIASPAGDGSMLREMYRISVKTRSPWARIDDPG
ncbi:MAG: TauD/TfdA dioxygenase family protein [Lautropia sp.]